MRELLEVEVHGFVAKCQERFEARGSGCVKLDGVGQGPGGCGRRAQVCENVVVSVAVVLGEACLGIQREELTKGSRGRGKCGH
jgi:hypothetical protein